jgi:nitroimidazol reductase NimA-like FMN-containing flavoprotein (pyridoxamine 5'-phosphate oxidase superfamily)
MRITEMSDDECRGLVAGGILARLACARDNQPYVVPIYYAYDQDPDGTGWVYGFTTAGQKVDWMRANPLVCVEWDEVVGHDRWASVIAFGRYEELPAASDAEAGVRLPERAARPEPPEEDGQRLRATRLLRERATWWQPAGAVFAARDDREPADAFRALYYRIRIDRLTGHRAVPDAPERPAPGRSTEGRWRRAVHRLTRVFSRRGGQSA